MIDAVKTTETAERLFDAFHETASAPDISVLDALLAVHIFLMYVDDCLRPDQRRQYRRDMRDFQDAHEDAPAVFS